jgi:histidine triad (HIT) family protein
MTRGPEAALLRFPQGAAGFRGMMRVVYNHAPADYACPFCRNVATSESDFPLEFLHRDDDVFVKMNPWWWTRNPGSVLVIPNVHYENVYDLPPELGTPIQRAIRDATLAMKTAWSCHDVSSRQHNEPSGNQDVWHFHVHVFPRWDSDDLYASDKALASEDQIHQRADELRAAWPSL